MTKWECTGSDKTETGEVYTTWTCPICGCEVMKDGSEPPGSICPRCNGKQNKEDEDE